jgi:DNA-binding NarL/FixJ family response regulator
MTGRGTGKTTVLLVDGEPLIRAGLRAIIDAEPDLTVVGETGDGAEVLPLVLSLRPRVVLMDVHMPDGIQVCGRIAATVEPPPKILVVTTHDDDQHAYAALRAGADGYLLTQAPPEDVVRAIRLIAGGEPLPFPGAMRTLAATHGGGGRGLAHFGLTEREAEVLRLMAAGMSNVEISERLVVSVQTVKTHVGNVLAKLGARNRTQAVIMAYETGFVTPG